MIEKTLTVTGMHCPNCTARVEKAAGTLNGVEEVHADFENDTCVVRYDGTPETLAAIKAAIEGEGFTVES